MKSFKKNKWQSQPGKSKKFSFFLVCVATILIIVTTTILLSHKYKNGENSTTTQHFPTTVFQTQLSFTSDSWTPLPPPPVGFQEGSGILVETGDGQRDAWFFGGYPIDKGYVIIYNIETQQWRLGPFFPWGLHHVFNAAFVTKTHLVVLGGIIYEDGKHRGNDAALIRRIGDETSPWQEKELPVGGVISCTSFDVGGKRWCYTGEQGGYCDVPFRFFEIEVETLRIKQLPIPPINNTHTTLLHDAQRGTIYMAAGRKTIDAKSTLSQMYMFDLQKSQWIPEVLDIPYSAIDTRSPVQIEGSDVALLLGGQNLQQLIISDTILQFHFDTRQFVWVDELPLQLMGFPSILLPNGKVMLASGGTGVGPKFTRLAWEWDPRDLLSTKQYTSSYTGEGLEVVHAHCGSIVVTRELQQKVAGGNTTIPAKWCHEEEATGPGNVAIVEALTVHFLRDGKMHSLTCDGTNSCKLGP